MEVAVRIYIVCVTVLHTALAVLSLIQRLGLYPEVHTVQFPVPKRSFKSGKANTGKSQHILGAPGKGMCLIEEAQGGKTFSLPRFIHPAGW